MSSTPVSESSAALPAYYLAILSIATTSRSDAVRAAHLCEGPAFWLASTAMPASKVGQPSSSSCVGRLMMSSRPTESTMMAHSLRVRFIASARLASDFLWKPSDPHCSSTHAGGQDSAPEPAADSCFWHHQGGPTVYAHALLPREEGLRSLESPTAESPHIEQTAPLRRYRAADFHARRIDAHADPYAV